jgi:hypothetical protein
VSVATTFQKKLAELGGDDREAVRREPRFES